MAYKEVSSLDAETTVALGKKDKAGKPYPKSAEGFYLGNRVVQNKRGESTIHFLQTAKGNLGVWGTTDLNRKLLTVVPGTMVRVTSTGTKPTPNGDMYTYKVEHDDTNTIEVAAAQEYTNPHTGSSGESDYESEGSDNANEDADNEDEQQSQALAAAERQARVQALLGSKGKKTA